MKQSYVTESNGNPFASTTPLKIISSFMDKIFNRENFPLLKMLSNFINLSLSRSERNVSFFSV